VPLAKRNQSVVVLNDYWQRREVALRRLEVRRALHWIIAKKCVLHVGRKNAKKCDLMKAKNAHNHWGGADGVEATKLINMKNEDNAQSMVNSTVMPLNDFTFLMSLVCALRVGYCCFVFVRPSTLIPARDFV